MVIGDELIQRAIAESGLPQVRLVAEPRVKTVWCTGSRRGGLALMKIAQDRPEPIPVYAKMSSINPVIRFPHGLAESAEDTAKAL